jgi:two-component system OmpR family response regulator
MSATILVVDDNKELVDLLTSLFEGSGYTVLGATKGRIAADLAKSTPPALVVIDLLLPDMMGFHVAESIRAVAPLSYLIFMSGVFKGARHSTEALGRFPGSKYFEKPFDAKALLETVRTLVPPMPSGISQPKPPPPPKDDFDVELDVDVEVDDEEPDAMELTGRIKVTGGGNLTAELRGADLRAAPAIRGPVGDRPLMHTSSIDLSPVPGRTNTPPPVSSGSARKPSRAGALGDNLPGLFSAFYIAHETGELYCQKGQVKKVVYFEGGQPVFALSNLAADRFGQFLSRVGKIRPDQLADVVAAASVAQKRTGDVLVERGLLRDTERLYYVAQQVKAIIYSLFGWEQGQFVVTFKEKARTEAIKLDVFPGNLIIRGIKKLYKPERLARLIRPEDRLMPSTQPPYQLHEIDLERWEAELLAKLDGTRTNAEVVAVAARPEHQVRAFLAAMLGVQVLERREA